MATYADCGSCNATGFEAVVNGAIQFSNDILIKVMDNTNDENLIVSPLSVLLVLAMAAFGAAGNTAVQMRRALHIPCEDKLGLCGFRTMLNVLNAVNGSNELSLANKIYTGSGCGFQIKPSFTKMTKEFFMSTSEQVDFRNPADAAATINHWCEEQTHNLIKDMISPDAISPDTEMILLNAVYFKGNWATEFKLSSTKYRPFHVDKENTKNVSTMSIKKKFKYGYIPEMCANFIEIPYEGDELSMVIILPVEVGGLKQVIDNLPRVKVGEILECTQPRELKVQLPKFNIKSTIDLRGILEEMGMTDMFRGNANFSRISETLLKVSDVYQKARIEINEKGSEAAAVTGIILRKMSTMSPPQPATMNVDHPFYYLIWNGKIPLFAGCVTDPSA